MVEKDVICNILKLTIRRQLPNISILRKETASYIYDIYIYVLSSFLLSSRRAKRAGCYIETVHSYHQPSEHVLVRGENGFSAKNRP